MPRVNFEMDDKFLDTLKSLANGGTTADTIQRAVATYQYLKSQVPGSESGRRVSITDAEGNVINNVILP